MAIWSAGVQAVTPQNLFAEKLSVQNKSLIVKDHCDLDLSGCKRLIVVGAGKASAAMAIAFYRCTWPKIVAALRGKEPQLSGWINCPDGAFDPQAQEGCPIYLHAARPVGVNQPTEEAVEGTRQILRLVRSATSQDVVLCLISGGGSALLPCPIEGVSLQDKQAIARLVSEAGGTITQLNQIRGALSEVKMGGLARACGASQLVSLIISDVIGDPLQVIASGPTVLDAHVDPQAALGVLTDLGLRDHADLRQVRLVLERMPAAPIQKGSSSSVTNVILANNIDAVDAAGVHAVNLGYRYVMQAANGHEGEVMQFAQQAVQAAWLLSQQSEVDCWISGGEPTAKLPTPCGKGGRNQQLALAVLDGLAKRGWPESGGRSLAFLSGGTDGEDGPTDVAGAMWDEDVWREARNMGIMPVDFLARADAYHFFEPLHSLFRTGPTGTNVCDLRIALTAPRESQGMDIGNV